jgi:aspartyl-tRNA(Asn)/glutamyl-tRNA(Gln) amidotransferase subunit C
MQPPAFDRATVDHLAALAALSLSDREAESLARDLRAIVAYVEELGAVDTSEVPGDDTRDVTSVAPAWRPDVLDPGLTREEALGGAARTTEAGFAVPGFVSAGSAGTARGVR